MVWMGKVINEFKIKPEPVIPFPKFSSDKLLELGLEI